MIRARSGRIVAIGSVAALQANPGNAAYAASKGALIAYCRTLAIESAKRGVTVNVIAPGFIDTGMMAPTPPIAPPWSVRSPPAASPRPRMSRRSPPF